MIKSGKRGLRRDCTFRSVTCVSTGCEARRKKRVFPSLFPQKRGCLTPPIKAHPSTSWRCPTSPSRARASGMADTRK